MVGILDGIFVGILAFTNVPTRIRKTVSISMNILLNSDLAKCDIPCM